MNNILTKIWLILSSFGIMFAVFSWVQESTDLIDIILEGSGKGAVALISGFILYHFIAKKI